MERKGDYLCPRCGKRMTPGTGSVLGDEDKNFLHQGDALKNGGIRIPVSNGITNDRTGAWVCEKCKFVLIDCNG